MIEQPFTPVWRRPAPAGRLLTIGDIHADLDALVWSLLGLEAIANCEGGLPDRIPAPGARLKPVSSFQRERRQPKEPSMPSINVPGSGHTAPAPNSGFQWLSYTNVRHKKVLDDAMYIIDNRIRGYRPCNDCFSRLPGGRTFDDVWADSSIWLSFDPQDGQRTYGATLGNDVTITAFSLRMGRWTTATTIVHELAHVNGAPGTNRQAENTLLSCLLSGLRDPNIIGAVQRGAGSSATV